MSIFNISPVLWSLDELISHGDDVIYDLALKCAGTLTSYRLLLGRCLLAIDQTKLYEKFGLSGSINFAQQCLKMNRREARSARRVALRLQELPRLTQAAQSGEIEWSSLREVVRVASVDTEELWLELCHKLNCEEVQQLVSFTPPGAIPGEVHADRKPQATEYRCTLAPEVVTLVERGLAMMSKREGKALSFADAVERLFIQVLTKKPYDEVAEKMREEASRDLMESQLQEHPLVARARTMAEEMGLTTQVGHPSPADESSRTGAGPSDGITELELAHFQPDETASLRIDPHADQPTDPEASPRVNQSGPQQTSPCNPFDPPGSRGDETDHRDGPTLLSRILANLRFNPNARFPSQAQRKALLRRDAYCCSTPGCPHHVWLELHHIKSFADGGKTLPDNVVTLCSRCHKHVQQGNLKITGRVSQGLVFTDSQGRRLDRIYRLERAGWLDIWLGWRGAETNSHQWRCAV